MSSFLLLEFLDKLPLHPLSLLPFFLSLIFFCKWLHINNTTRKNSPPSPPKLPILGNLLQLGKLPHRSLRSLSEKYGELMLLELGNKPVLVVSSANAAREIMKTHDVIFSNRPKSKITSKLLYNEKDISFANYGEYWRQMKSICVLQLLSNTRVRSFRTIREEETGLMVEKIKRSTPSLVNLSEMIVTQTNDVVCRAAFGRKYSGEDGSNFKELLKNFTELLGVPSIGDLIPWMGWIDKLNGLDRKLDKVAKEFDMLLEGILEEHLDGLNTKGNCDEDAKEEKVKDFVDVLIERKDGLSIDRESIKAIILDMFAAGTETTYTLLEWAMSELLRQPKVLNELQQELRTIGQGKSSINEDDLQKSMYLKAVIKETLRLHPPLPLLVFQELTQDVKINGYEIVAGTQVITNSWAIQRDPAFREVPDEFYPGRFLSSSIDFKGHDFQLIPFGAGRRSCPGILFATINAELILANLVYAFDWALPDGAKGETLDMNESGGLTIHRRDHVLAVATPYHRK